MIRGLLYFEQRSTAAARWRQRLTQRLNAAGNFRLSRPAARAATACPGRMNHRAGGSVSSSLHPPAE